MQSLISEHYDGNQQCFTADLFDFISCFHGFLEPNRSPDEQGDSDKSYMESDDVFEEGYLNF